MTTEESRVMSLVDKLPNHDELVQSIQYDVIQRDWDNHHCRTVYVSDTIEDYQVLRAYDIEIDYIYVDDDTNTDNWDIDDWDKNTYECEIGEMFQIWLNLSNNKVTKIGKVWKKNPIKWDYDGKFEIVSNRKGKKKVFCDYFCTGNNEGFYTNYSVHETLKKNGYDGIDAFNWAYGCGEEDNYSPEAKFCAEHNMIDTIFQFSQGVFPQCDKIKYLGMANFLRLDTMGDKEYKKEVINALKICRRNNYIPSDYNLWYDMIKFLYELKKDLHNAYYVCPQDLRKAHDKWFKKYDDLQKQIQREKDREKQAEFEKTMKKFFDLLFEKDNIVIRPLRSIQEYQEEGQAMHHCVGSYWNHKNCLILSARDKENNRLATIEVNTNDFSIVQVRALQNAVSPYDKQIRELITKNMSKIKKAKLKKSA